MDLSEIACANGMFLSSAGTSETSPRFKGGSHKDIHGMSLPNNGTANLSSVLGALWYTLSRGEKSCMSTPVGPFGGVLFAHHNSRHKTGKRFGINQQMDVLHGERVLDS